MECGSAASMNGIGLIIRVKNLRVNISRIVSLFYILDIIASAVGELGMIAVLADHFIFFIEKYYLQ